MERKIRQIHLRQNQDQRKQKQLEDEKRPAPAVHGRQAQIAKSSLIGWNSCVKTESKGKFPAKIASRDNSNRNRG